MKKESFLIYKDFYKPIEELTDQELGSLFRALFRYQIEGIEEVDPAIRIPFRFFVNQFKIDQMKYDRRVESARENGKLGGRPPKKPTETEETESVIQKPKKADKVKEKETVKVKGKEKETEKINKGQNVVLPFGSDRFSEAWEEWKRYKRDQFRFTYKSERTEQTALKKLQELSEGSEERALLILEQSVGNGWSGLFPLKNQPQQIKGGSGIDQEYIQELKNRLQ
jgi:hypothetical protein